MIGIETLVSVFSGELKAQYDDRGRWAQIEEGKLLFDIVQSTEAELFFEIGTANGWTACWAALAGAEVHTFDVANRPKVYLDRFFPLPDIIAKIKFSPVGSPDCVALMRNLPRSNKPVVFFIDGDHSYPAIKLDFESILPLTRPKDVVVFHDTGPGCSGVHKLWRQTRRRFPGQCVTRRTVNGMGFLTI